MAIFILLLSALALFGAYQHDKAKKAEEVISLLQKAVSEKDEVNENLIQWVEIFNEEITLREDLTSIIVDASRAHGIDPKLLAHLIKSESNFRPNPKHALPNIVCMAGINTKANPKTKHNPNSVVGCVYASAELLAKYIEDSDSLTLALTKYKGFSPLGHKQAKEVLKDYKN